jgi:amino acid adenylation domain-containing protein
MNKKATEGFRVSSQQRRLWSLQNGYCTGPYVTQAAILIQGDLQTASLAYSLRSVIQRHEVLRSKLLCVGGMRTPVQVISDDAIPALEFCDVSDLGDESQDREIELLFRGSVRRGFDLANGPVLRVSLIALGGAKYVMLISMPAIWGDLATIHNLVKDIIACESSWRGEALSEPSIQYADFSQWEYELLTGDEANGGRDHWRSRMLSSSQPPVLPCQQERAPAQSFVADTLTVHIDRSLAARVDRLAAREGTPAGSGLSVCWQLLLHQLTGQADLVIGIRFDGRPYDQLRNATGLYARYLPIHTHAEGGTPVGDFFVQCGAEMQRARMWQEYFVSDDDGARISISFPFTFEMNCWPSFGRPGGPKYSLLRQFVCIEPSVLRLSCFATEDSMVAEFHYDRAALSRETVQVIANQYNTLLAALSQDSAISIGALQSLNGVHKHLLSLEFNDTSETTTQAPVPNLIQAQAGRTPERVAVVFEDEYLTYQELNRRANQLARYLGKLQAASDQPIAVCADPSLEVIIGLVAILKTGRAYVPLSPALPTVRITSMLRECGASIMLTMRGLSASVEARSTTIVCLDADWPRIANEYDAEPQNGLEPEDLAYVLFTSGTTGGPKAVAVEHRQLTNYISGIRDRLQLPEEGAYALVSPITADLGHTVLFPPLCRGGTVHVLPVARVTDAARMGEYFRRCSIDVLKIVPSHLDALLDCKNGDFALPRQRLVLGGEASSWEFARKVQEATPGCIIFNHYGPTETTVGAMAYRANHRSIHPGIHTVKLGRPLTNVRVYLLDQRLNQTGIGMCGELFIGGGGVARGYFRRPDLTAERFLPDPYSPEAGSRFYRTGDLALWAINGDVMFKGRCDHEVKIRGFRVEPGEVEAAVKAHASVRACAVVFHKDQTGRSEGQLVAYIVRSWESKDTKDTLDDIRNWLKNRLPDYMVPALFVPLQSLPLTANGKLDRRSLPAPSPGGKGSKPFLAPRTPVEELLAGIWSEILCVEEVAADDDFFQLGGDSLLAIRIASRIRKTFQIELLPRYLFESPTVAQLADRLVECEPKPGQVATIARLRKRIGSMSAAEKEATLHNAIEGR